jgi:hypothetical protein
MIGETYEKAGDLREAHRWLNLAVRRFGGRAADDDSTNQGIDLILLAIVRLRIRRALGLPPDAVDRLGGLALTRRGETTGEW